MSDSDEVLGPPAEEPPAPPAPQLPRRQRWAPTSSDGEYLLAVLSDPGKTSREASLERLGELGVNLGDAGSMGDEFHLACLVKVSWAITPSDADVAAARRGAWAYTRFRPARSFCRLPHRGSGARLRANWLGACDPYPGYVASHLPRGP